MKRGMLPFRPGGVALRLADVLVRPRLPAVPRVYGHVSRQQPPVAGGWGALGNRDAGDCVVAGACHEVQDWFWATGRSVPRFTDASALADYSRMLVAQGGRPYDPGDPTTDAGLDPVAAAAWRQTVGLTDADGAVHQIGPFASVSDPDELDIAAYVGGAAACCWALPNSAEAQFEVGEVWDDTSGEPGGGHYTMIGGRNSVGNRMFVTWGRLQAATDAYVAKYMTGGLSYASREYVTASGVTPEAIDWAKLAAYQSQLGASS